MTTNERGPARLSADYGGPINEYSEDGADRKRRFLRDAGKLLRRTGYALAERHGMTETRVSPNKAGIAVSGEVYGEFRAPGKDAGVMVEVGTSCLGGDVLGNDGREDGVVVRACWQCRKRSYSGPNVWLSPSLDSDGLAAALVRIMENVPNVAI